MTSITAESQTIQTKIVGVTYENRQVVVAQLKVGEQVFLVREPSNPFDRNAIMVIRQDGQQIGYVDRYLAARLSSELDQYGRPVKAIVSTITGGYTAYSNLGVIIQFELPD